MYSYSKCIQFFMISGSVSKVLTKVHENIKYYFVILIYIRNLHCINYNITVNVLATIVYVIIGVSFGPGTSCRKTAGLPNDDSIVDKVKII